MRTTKDKDNCRNYSGQPQKTKTTTRNKSQQPQKTETIAGNYSGELISRDRC
jgi:hypothetical protein